MIFVRQAPSAHEFPWPYLSDIVFIDKRDYGFIFLAAVTSNRPDVDTLQHTSHGDGVGQGNRVFPSRLAVINP